MNASAASSLRSIVLAYTEEGGQQSKPKQQRGGRVGHPQAYATADVGLLQMVGPVLEMAGMSERTRREPLRWTPLMQAACVTP